MHSLHSRVEYCKLIILPCKVQRDAQYHARYLEKTHTQKTLSKTQLYGDVFIFWEWFFALLDDEKFGNKMTLGIC